nr:MULTISPECIES: tandem-95 repeat protein [Myxococcaceae]
MSAASFTTPEDTVLRGNLRPADTGGSSALSFATTSAPSHGTLALQADGAFVYTPAQDFAGEDHFSVELRRGESTFPPAEVTITVSPVNDAPVLKGTLPALSTPEDTALALSAADLVAADVDDALSSLTLSVSPGANYTFSSGRLVPAQDFHGTLELDAQVSDGKAQVPVHLSVTVTPVNDAPVISAQAGALAGTEDSAFSVSLADVVASDVDNAAAELSLSVLDGPGYTHVGNTVTPAQDLNGALAVQVAVSDGSVQSAPFALSVTLAPVNDAPVIRAQAALLTTAEDTALALSLADVTVTDVDSAPAAFTLTAAPGSHYSLQGNTLIPEPDFNGTLLVPVTVSDESVQSTAFTLSVAVTPVNDAPVIQGQAHALTTAEDTAITLVLADLNVTDVDSAASALSLVVLDGAGYSHVGNTVTPAQDATAPLAVQVAVRDGSAQSATFALQVGVTPVNDAPVIDAQAHALSTLEDTALTLSLADLDLTDVDSAPAALSLVVLDGAGYAHTGAQITPAQDANGPLTVQVAVSDGQAQSAPFSLAVSVTPVNDAPVIASQAHALSTAEDTALSLSLADVSATDVDNTQAELSLAVQDGAGYSHVGNTVTPAADFNGTLSVSVRVSDGQLDSAPFSLSISVTPVNDPPVITAQARALSTDEDTAFTVSLADVSANDLEGSPLTLAVQDGAGYTHAGNVVTPVRDASGPLQVGVRVSDGTAESALFLLDATVRPVNDAPVIVSQAHALSTQEDVPLTLGVDDVSITDVDSSSFTLAVQDDPGYSHVGNTVTPPSNFSGTLRVPVVVSDGAAQSAVFELAVTVGEVNDAPVITRQARAVSTPEDTAFALSLADVTVVDPDNTQAELSLVVQDGPGYGHVGNTVTPAQDSNGALQVGVRVSDGTDLSAVFQLQVSVTPVNDAPVIVSQARPLATDEDTAFAVALTDVTVTDVDSAPASFSLSVLDGQGYSHVGNSVTPAQDANGPLQVRVAVSDGTDTSLPFALDVTVRPVNDAPVIASQAHGLSTLEDAPLTLTLADVVAADVDSPPASFSLVVLPGSQYTVSGTQITPASHYHGPLTVDVAVSDGAAQSAPFALAVTVISVNNAPEILQQARALSTPEDIATTLVLSDVVATDADGDALTLVVLDGAGYSHAGNSVTPVQDFFGALKVRVAVTDGEASSAPFELDLTVTPVNDAPVIVSQHNARFTAEDTALTLVLGDVDVTDVDLPLQTLTLAVQDGTGYTHVGNSVTPAQDFFGALKVRVTVSDGTASSAPFDFEVSVTPVNDAPVITTQVATLSMPEDGSLELPLSAVSVTDVDSDPGSLTLSVEDGAGYTHAGNSVTPPQDFNGTLSVSVRVSDGVASSAPFSVSITVTPVNDAPKVTSQRALAINEDVTLPLAVSDLTIVDPDSSTFTLTVGDGANYTRSGNSITPVSNFWGTLSVPVTVSDGSLSSPTFTVTVTVNKVNKLPVVGADSYSTVGNTELLVSTAASGVLANDSDRESTLVVSAFSATSTQGGNVGVNADGTFFFRPKAGFVGTDTFTYTAKESDNTQTVVGTVTVSVVGPVVWYVNSASTNAVADGRSQSPFKSLTAAGTASSASVASIIFVYRGNSANAGAAYTAVTLDPNQQLLGEPTGLTLAPNVSIPAAVASAANMPVIGQSVTLASGTVVKNVIVSSTGNGLVGSGVSGFSLLNVPVTAASEGVVVSGSGAATLDTVPVTSTNGRALSLTGFSSVTVPQRNVDLVATKGAALELVTVGTADVSVNSLKSTNSLAQGVHLEGITTGSLTVKQPISISSAVGAGAGAQQGMLVRTFAGTLVLPQLVITGGQQGLVVDGFSGTLSLAPTTGVAGAGANIQNTYLSGITLGNASGVTLRRILVSTANGDGLRIPDGAKVTGLILSDSTFTNTGSAAPTLSNWGLNLGRGAAGRNAQLDGTSSMTDVTLTNWGSGGLLLENGSGTLSLTLLRLLVKGTIAGPGILVRTDATNGGLPQLTLLVDRCQVNGMPSGSNGLDVATDGGRAILTATVQDSNFDNASMLGNSAMRFSADGASAALTANVLRNTMRNWVGHSLLLQGGDQSVDLRATVDGNTIVGDTAFAATSRSLGNGIRVLMDPDPANTALSGRVLLANNTIQMTGLSGIDATVRQSLSSAANNRLDLLVRNNNIDARSAVDPANGNALAVRATGAGSTLCTSVTGNTLNGASFGALFQQTTSGSFTVQGLATATVAGVQSYLTGNNPTVSPFPTASGTFAAATANCNVP